jgi:hypothetical protein
MTDRSLIAGETYLLNEELGSTFGRSINENNDMFFGCRARFGGRGKWAGIPQRSKPIQRSDKTPGL